MDVGRPLGNYLIVRLLGQGGFADVFLGQHKILQTYAAIKVMHTHLSPTELQNFVTEAKTIANLKHPSIDGITAVSTHYPTRLPCSYEHTCTNYKNDTMYALWQLN